MTSMLLSMFAWGFQRAPGPPDSGLCSRFMLCPSAQPHTLHPRLVAWRCITAGVIEPLSLEMDADSEDELEAMVDAAPPSGSAPALAGEEAGGGLRAQRFALLRDLWAAR